MRRPLVPLTLVAGVLLLGALALFGRSSGLAPDPEEPTPALPPVRVAAGPDAESGLLANILVALLALQEVEAEVVAFSDARDTRQALERGDVEVRPGYTGEAWLETLGRADPPGDPRASFEEVRSHDAQVGLLWFRPRFLEGIDEPPANATFAFVVPGPPSVDADLTTLSQLASRLSARPRRPCASTRSSPPGPTGCGRCWLPTASAATSRCWPHRRVTPCEAWWPATASPG
jgi:glycine betaine/choline ABC-type transport system substrate-binding protein